MMVNQYEINVFPSVSSNEFYASVKKGENTSNFVYSGILQQFYLADESMEELFKTPNYIFKKLVGMAKQRKLIEWRN